MTSKKPVSPCVGIICFRGDDVLMIRRGKPPKQGQWSIPGGRIEFGEPAKAAALRELIEETGVTAELCGLVDVVDGLFPAESGQQDMYHYLLCDYVARWISGEPVAGDDAAHAEFISPARLQALTLAKNTRRVIEAAKQTLATS